MWVLATGIGMYRDVALCCSSRARLRRPNDKAARFLAAWRAVQRLGAVIPSTQTQCRARLMRVRHDCPDATRVCASSFTITAQTRRSQTVTAATSGSLRNIPSMLSSLLSFAPGPRMARAPHNISTATAERHGSSLREQFRVSLKTSPIDIEVGIVDRHNAT